MDIKIDACCADLGENRRYRGNGMVSANNSSRLLLDYKTEFPTIYEKLLKLIFSDEGIGVNHLKIEMGSDINSSSGTEPCIMRRDDELPNCRRGAGFQLAGDAKRVNPNLTIDMLWWSEPLWVTNSHDVYDARYRWYKANLCSAYEVYGLVFDYVSVSRNEREVDGEWIKYISRRLKSEKDCPYPFSKIKIVAADEETRWHIADLMMKDEELKSAIDVICSHYTSFADDNAKRLVDEFGKEAWLSEASSPMRYQKGTKRFDKSGLCGVNGMLDIAARFVTMFPEGKMTLCEYQPVVSAYYDGVTFCSKQLITANEPWCGSIELNAGFYMALHFSRFYKKGWAFIPSGCYSDGKAGGDGHAVVEVVHCIMTAIDIHSGNLSTTIVNTTDAAITYNFTIANISAEKLFVWITNDSESFKKIDEITPQKSGEVFEFSYSFPPFSLTTLTTLESPDFEFTQIPGRVMRLPFYDDYSYTGFHEDYLFSRGGAPRYTTDEGGAFEVCELDGRNVLTQMITPDIKALEWGGTPSPTTNFGDDRWLNYRACCKVLLVGNDDSYAGVGARYKLACIGESGYSVRLYKSGEWKLLKNSLTICKGKLLELDKSGWNKLEICAENKRITASINDEMVCEYNDSGAVLGAGRSALFSSYDNNCFSSLAIEPVGNIWYINRFDNTDYSAKDIFSIEYIGDWQHNFMSGFADYKRTISIGSRFSAMKISFWGSGIIILGKNEECTISCILDGKVLHDEYKVEENGSREALFSIFEITKEPHLIELRVIIGELSVDSVEIVP